MPPWVVCTGVISRAVNLQYSLVHDDGDALVDLGQLGGDDRLCDAAQAHTHVNVQRACRPHLSLELGEVLTAHRKAVLHLGSSLSPAAGDSCTRACLLHWMGWHLLPLHQQPSPQLQLPTANAHPLVSACMLTW